MDEEGVQTYLDKQTLERIVVDKKMMERLEKRRDNEKSVTEGKKVLAPVFDFTKYRK